MPNSSAPIHPAEHLTPYLAELAQCSPAIARQFRRSDAEDTTSTHECGDPIGDLSHSPVPGIVHRYPDRVLLLPTMACAATCRFCFRRDRLNDNASRLDAPALTTALDYIAAHPEIHEVILSGGDPLTLSKTTLAAILHAIDIIDHVDVIRIHTRLPVVAPHRIAAIAEVIGHADLETACWLALHINHSDEWTPECAAAVRCLQEVNVTCVSQSVLLAGINDDADVLRALFRTLVKNRVKPYYLHQLDHAQGTGHFRVPLDKGRALMNDLRATLSGLAQPAYILDIPGGHGKVWATDSYIREAPETANWTVTAPDGAHHAYPPGTDLCVKPTE